MKSDKVSIVYQIFKGEKVRKKSNSFLLFYRFYFGNSLECFVVTSLCFMSSLFSIFSDGEFGWGGTSVK